MVHHAVLHVAEPHCRHENRGVRQISIGWSAVRRLEHDYDYGLQLWMEEKKYAWNQCDKGIDGGRGGKKM